MNSPLVRVILTTICGYLLIVLFLSLYEWSVEEYPRRPVEPITSERIQHTFHHPGAIKALQLFSQLPKPEKTAILENLTSHLISVKQWLTCLGQSKFQIMCMGELHKESTRRFLSETFFPNFSFDVLLLEATPRKLKHLLKRMEAGRDYFPLLDADIMNLLRTVRNKNPNIKIYGIEETENQAKNHYGHSNSRDQSIAQNFWTTFKPGMRHIILFGALHCTNESNWLFGNLRSQAPPALRNKMLNVWVLGEHQNGPLEAFVYFLDEIGVEKRNFVIPDTSALPQHLYEWFPLLSHQILEKYRSLIIFRT
jgi:hypothetical protein